jgi:hypothetical protein
MGSHVAYTPPIIWNERPYYLDRWCVSYDEESLGMRIDPLEYSDSPFDTGMEGGVS